MAHTRLPESTYRQILRLALEEDIGTGDITARAVGDQSEPLQARIIAKEDLVLCGLDVAKATFVSLDPQVTFDCPHQDGDSVNKGDVVLLISGESAALLTAERTALNFLQRLSGVATLAKKYVHQVHHTHAKVVDTRKTTPGLRALQKYAVRTGGAGNHRTGLYDGVLIKENHIRSIGSIGEAVTACRQQVHHLMKIEVEVTNMDELTEALLAKADTIMLDNFTPAEVKAAVLKNNGQALLEVSGGITLETIRDFAKAGADIISVGALTHSAPAVDLSMLFD